MYILGIDPGFGRVGYGIIEYRNNKYRPVEYGCITTPAGEKLSTRLKKIAEDLEEVISRYSAIFFNLVDNFSPAGVVIHPYSTGLYLLFLYSIIP